MSRIGSASIKLGNQVSCSLSHGTLTILKNSEPKCQINIPSFLDCVISNDDVKITVKDGIDLGAENSSKKIKGMWGTTRSNIANAVKGLQESFFQSIELVGTGYRASSKDGKLLVLSLGYSSDCYVAIPEDIKVQLPKPNLIEVRSPRKESLGTFIAILLRLRKVEPYKLKGVRLVGKKYLQKDGKKK